jgi:type IV pilus assembly protein PilX
MNRSNFAIPHMPRRTFSSRHSQQGVVLIVALLFLIMLTVIAISSSNLATVEERMARNSRDYNIAFQAAEAALRDAEADIRGDGPSPRTPKRISGITGFTTACTAGLCGTSTGAEMTTRPWEATGNYLTDTTKSVAYGYQTGALPLALTNQSNESVTPAPAKIKVGGVSRQPRYLVEGFLDKSPGITLQPPKYGGGSANKFVYRTTAIGFGSLSGTQVIVQSLYKLP